MDSAAHRGEGGIPVMRGLLALAMTLCTVGSASAMSGKISSFVGMCKSDLKKDTVDNRAIRNMKVDPTGLCVCVVVVLDSIVSDAEMMALSGKPLPKEFINKVAATQNYCVVLLVDAAMH